MKGQWIKQWLEANERSILWLSKKSGISHTRLRRLFDESIPQSMSVDNAKSLAGAMGVSVVEFLKKSQIIPQEWMTDPPPLGSYPADVKEALADPEMMDLVRKIWKLKKTSPEVDVQRLVDRFAALPGDKQQAILAMIR